MYPPHTPAPAHPPAAPTPTPQPAGMVKSKAGGWVPPDHPDADTSAAPAAPAAPGGTAPLPPSPVAAPPGGQLAPAPGTVPPPPSVNPIDYNKPAAPTGQPGYLGPPDEQRITRAPFDTSGEAVSPEQAARRAAIAQLSPEQFAMLRAGNTALGRGEQPTPEQAAIMAQFPPTPGDASRMAANRALGGQYQPGGVSGLTPEGDPLRDQIQNAIVTQLGQTAVPGEDDPVIRAQMGGIEATAERQRRARQAASAERLAGQGLAESGAADAELASGYQDQATMVADNQRQLLLAETQDRRNRIQQTLATGAQFLTADKQAELQKELGYLNAQLQREGYRSEEERTGMTTGSAEKIVGAQLATDQWKTNVSADLQRAGFRSAEAIATLGRDAQERIAQLDAQMKQAGYASNERMAALDTAVKQAQIASSTGLGMADINLRGQLGRGQLNLGLLGLLQGDAAGRDRLNFDVGKYQQDQNYLATLAMLGGGG